MSVHRLHRGKRQSGVALVIGLVMLLVITLIAVAGMSSSTMHEKMSANAQNINRTFQAAESAVGALTGVLTGGDTSLLQTAMAAGKGIKTNTTPFDIEVVEISSDYAVTYLGEVAVTSGSSMDANESTTLLKGYRFELQGTAEIAAVSARTRIFKGVEYH